MKDRYFPHDFYARLDTKLVKLQKYGGYEAKGFFWDLIELLYEHEGELENNPELLSVMMNNQDVTYIRNTIEYMCVILLLYIKDDKLRSHAVDERLACIFKRRKIAKANIQKRWKKSVPDSTCKSSEINTTVIQPENIGNTIKGKERKGKNIDIDDLYLGGQQERAPKKQREKKPLTIFSIKESIPQEDYQKMLDDKDLAAGDRQWLYRQAKTMADHFGSTRRQDWTATLRNWCRKARYQFNDPPGGQKKLATKPTTFDLNRDMLEEVVYGKP